MRATRNDHYQPGRRRWLGSLLALGSAPAAMSAAPSNEGAHDAAVVEVLELSCSNDEAQPALPAGQFRNPILPGFFPDPSICRVPGVGGDDYYLASSTFAAFPGVALHHSRDLVNWRLIGHAINRPQALRYGGLHISRGLFAPDLSCHDGRWYLVCTMVGAGGNFVVTADRPEGPWSDPVWLGFEGIDPALFFDTDANGQTRAWMLNNGAPEGQPLYSGHRAIWLQRFDLKTLQMTGPRRVLVNGGVDISKQPVWIEGPHLYKRDGWYVLSAAEGGTSLEHSQVVLRSRNVEGPYEPWTGNPTLTQRDLNHRVPGAVACTGHADFIDGPDGQTWAVFLGCRPLPDGHWLLGRETFLLPVQWTPDGWPQILPAGQRVPLQRASPVATTVQAANPGWQADFTRQPPRHEDGWLTLRAAPLPPASARGLQLPAGADALEGLGQPSALLRRVQHLRFTLQARLRMPLNAQTQAGLVLFQSERQHELLSVVTRADAPPLLRLQRCEGGQLRTLHEVALPGTPPGLGELRLRVQADERQLRYAWSADGQNWQPVGDAHSHRAISVQAAGDGNHFTGLLAGLHARRLPAA